ncbi:MULTISPECIES: hypothetical protein [unclassified Carboxylicivirga]|uniref:hypothetical protein n=1 Tax=Carboxylicivirga TaxID=1628153 RepID=UPI003D34CDA3
MTIDASYLELLEKQMTLIDQRDFDLASWKKATILITSSCFGVNSPQVAAIDKIDYAYSSWALRDESGTGDPVKTECKTILSTIISEYKIRLSAKPSDDATNTSNGLEFMWLPFEDELTGAALKKLKLLITKANVQPEEVEAFLKDFPNQTLVNILQRALLAKEFKQWLNQ